MARKLKGLVAAVFAVLFAVALAPRAAFALEANGSLTVSNLKAGDKVSLYWASTSYFDDEKTGNIIDKSWNGFAPVNEDGTTITVDDYCNDDLTVAQREAIANKVASLVVGVDNTLVKTTTSEGDSVTFEGLYPGLYYAKVVNDDDASVVYQNTLIPVNLKAENGAWVYDVPVTVELKKSVVSITKRIQSDHDSDATYGSYVKEASYGTEDMVHYQLTVVVPQYSDATTRTFFVEDVLPKGIEYAHYDGETWNSLGCSAQVNGVDFYPSVSPEDENQKLTFDLSQLLEDNAGKTVTINYSAKFTGTTLVEGGRVNTATLTFSANNEDDTYKTVSDSAKANSGAVKVILKDEDGNLISGAKLFISDGNTEVIRGTGGITDANGELVFDIAISGDRDWTIGCGWMPAGYGIISQSVSVDPNNGNTVVEITAPKVSGWLPSTGGAGTFGITLLGVLVVAGVAALHVGSRKRD